MTVKVAVVTVKTVAAALTMVIAVTAVATVTMVIALNDCGQIWA